MAWLSRGDRQTGSPSLNIEEVFHYAPFDIEYFRLGQQFARVGRGDGPGTSWNMAEYVEAWLSQLEEALSDVIFEKDENAELTPITRWAENVGPEDSVVTFNYDTLVERALDGVGKVWNHAMPKEENLGIAVCKLLGSIDWIVAHRSDRLSKLVPLFEKTNENAKGKDTGNVEDDCLLWRCQPRDRLRKWISGRFVQGASPENVGIAGLGTYKQLHQIPGSVYPWSRGMDALYKADVGVVVGFSMSEFDAMAQMQFAGVARKRSEARRPLSIVVVDPSADAATEKRFRRVFETVRFERCRHEEFDWSSLRSGA